MSRVCIIYPCDPLGVTPGGIETFIDGLIRWAPDDAEMSLVGITTDPTARPVGRWTECALGERKFRFFPVLAHTDTRRRPLVPVALRFMLKLAASRPAIDADILEFHRIEPVLPFLRDRRPKTSFMHQNMAILRDKNSDIRWKHAPGLYFALEGFVIRRLSKVFCVREDAAAAYRKAYPALSERFEFTPTWADPQLFSPAPAETRRALREALTRGVGLSPNDEILMTVGRLDRQKDPLLLLEAFARAVRRRPSLKLLLVGDGILRPDVERFIEREALGASVVLTGLMPKTSIADWLRAADAFVLSSAYEGMPMAVLEALASGLPVVATDVGEVSRVVAHEINGEVVTERSPAALAGAIERTVARREAYAGAPCTSAVAAYSPREVVSKIPAEYRACLRARADLRPASSRAG